MQARITVDYVVEKDEFLRPVCVDLDHTLIQTDSLIESIFLTIKAKPWFLLVMPFLFLLNRAKLKAKVASLSTIDPVYLPYNDAVIFYLKRMAKRGHPIYLVTGANQKIASAIGNYLQIFSGVYASSDTLNLVGKAKADLLVKQFGERGFEYIGDSKADLAVWQHARTGSLVSNSMSLLAQAKGLTEIENVFPVKSGKLKASIKELRIYQWFKNVLVFLPMLLAHRFNEGTAILNSVLAFLAFSFMASATYVINDLSDLDADRRHDDKEHRPFASGVLPLSMAAILVPVMVGTSAFFASFLNASFAAVLLAYVITTNLYTFYLKRVPMADIVILSSLYSIRLVGGGVVNDIEISPWLAAFTGFLFISLAMIKRCSELLILQGKGESKTSGRGYSVVDIPIIVSFGSASGYGAILVLALYINSEVAKAQYKSERLLWCICPLMIYWISRMWFLANRGLITHDPVKFTMTDRVSWGVFALAAIIWYVASSYALSGVMSAFLR